VASTSPYEAAAWAVLSQRIRIVQAARLRDDLVRHHGEADAFPAPQALRKLELELPGRKSEYLHAVADTALEGGLDAAALRSVKPGPGHPHRAGDQRPGPVRRRTRRHPRRYGPEHTPAVVSEAWRPFRTWAVVHLRALQEQRTAEISGGSSSS